MTVRFVRMKGMSMASKQPTIAAILHCAADKCLVAHSRYSEGCGKEKYSCCAIDEALYKMTGSAYSGDSNRLRHRVVDGLKAMGCKTRSSTLFKNYGDVNDYNTVNHDVQGMRYMWLKWAALMAEEQGV